MTPEAPPAEEILTRFPELSSDEFLERFVRGVEDFLDDTDGWGAWRLYALAPFELLAAAGSRPGPVPATTHAPVGFAEAEPAHPSASNPYDGLCGARFHPSVVGAVVVSETWAYPPELRHGNGDPGALLDPGAPLEPGRHPHRIRRRVVHLVTRGPREVFLTRGPHGDPEITTDADPGVPAFRGRVSGALRRSLGLPAHPAMYPYTAFFARLAAGLAAEDVEAQVAAGGSLTWPDLVAAHPQIQARMEMSVRHPEFGRQGWERHHAGALAGDDPVITAELAEWMGVDLYADWTMAHTVSVADSLATIEALGHRELAARIAAEFSRVGWEDRPATPPPAERFRPASRGRNSPCPCGSGRKSKHCCAAH